MRRRAPTGALLDTCFRQVEYAGVLQGAKNPAGAQQVIDFLLSADFQASVPDSMYVYPVDSGVPLPAAWQQYAPVAAEAGDPGPGRRSRPTATPGSPAGPTCWRADAPMTATTDRARWRGWCSPRNDLSRPSAAEIDIDPALRATARVAGWVLLAGLPVTMFAVFFFYPVGSLIGRGLIPGGTVDLQGVIDVLGKPRVQRIALFTVWQAAASAALAVVLGLPGAYVLYRCRFRGRTALRALVTVPFVLPTDRRRAGLPDALRRRRAAGLLGVGRLGAVILAAHVFLNYAVVVRTVGASWAHLDNRPAEAARSLAPVRCGCSLTITLPSLLPAIAAAFVMVFLFCATSFGIMLILGGPSTGPWRPRSTGRPRRSATCGPRPCCRSCSWLWWSWCWSSPPRVRRRGEATLRLRAARRSGAGPAATRRPARGGGHGGRRRC